MQHKNSKLFLYRYNLKKWQWWTFETERSLYKNSENNNWENQLQTVKDLRKQACGKAKD